MMIKFLLALIVAIFLPLKSVKAEEPKSKIPNFIGESGLSGNTSTSTVRVLRFLTTLDSPPLSFLDQDGRLSGFNVYLAKSICSELKIQSACTIQAMPRGELIQALFEGRGDAIVAGLDSADQTHEDLSFSNSYLRFPGRFIALRTSTASNDFNGGLPGKKIGVLAGTAQEKLIRSFFPQAAVIGFAGSDQLYSELNTGKIDLIFGDGLTLGFFVSGETSNDCCLLVGGAYYSGKLLGEGMRIATAKTRPDLIQAIDGALASIQAKHGIEELFLRFFPYNYY